MLAYIAESVNKDRLRRIEYPLEENRVLRNQPGEPPTPPPATTACGWCRRCWHPLGSPNRLKDSRLRELTCGVYFFVGSSLAFFRNGVNRSIGIGMNVAVLCSLAISDIVCKKRNCSAMGCAEIMPAACTSFSAA